MRLDLPHREPWYPLTGREDFDPNQLSREQHEWYERLWEGVENSRAVMLRRVATDDTTNYGRWLFQYASSLLIGLRTTGDLQFLDELDRIAEAMRSQLADSWCGDVSRSVTVNVRYGTVSNPDGFLNFRYRGGASRDHCRDTGDLDEALVHGNLAMIMYAYHANRDLPSPIGIDYAERADFWLDYLRNHFEAKWRSRNGPQWPAMDFIDMKFCHTYHQMALFYYFVGARLHDEGSDEARPYLEQAVRMTDGMFEVPYIPRNQPGGFIEVETPAGPAVVFSFGAPGSTDVSPTHLEACPMTYARYMYTSILALRMEGFYRWNDDIMTKLATTVAHFLIGTERLSDRQDPFAAGVTGDRDVAGLPRTEYRGRSSFSDFTLSPFAAYSVWDDTGIISRTALQAYHEVETDPDSPQQVMVPASMLLIATVAASTD